MKPIFRLGLLCAALWIPLAAMPEEITVNYRIKQVGEVVKRRIKPFFARQRIAYPPSKLAMVVLKDEKRLKIFAPDPTGDWQFIYQYQIAKLSGKPGPKLRAGDMQVPEGIYTITHLNPASKFWLSLALNYPNTFDRRQAKREGRKQLGGDIMMHGWWFSEGCIAMGNTAAEDLFVMAHDVGLDNISVIIAPTDFRNNDSDSSPVVSHPSWTKDLYADIKTELNKFGSDGMTTDSRLIAYADIAPPPPPEPTTLFGKILRALANAAETSGTSAADSD